MKKTTLAQPVAELPVEDVEKALAYYVEKLGFYMAWLDDSKWIGAVERDDMAIFFRKTTTPFTPNTHWVFAEDVDASYEELKNRGADITDPIEDKPWNQRQFTVRDLNGHLFYIHHDI